MPSYSIEDKLKAIETVSVMLDLSKSEKVSLINKVLSPMGIEISGKFIANDLNEEDDKLFQKELVVYDNLPNKPPIDEREFLCMLASKGLLVKYKNDFLIEDYLVSNRFLRKINDGSRYRILFIKDEFENLLKYIGLSCKDLFEE